MKLDTSSAAISETKKEITAFKKSQGIGGLNGAGKGSCPRSNFSEAFRSNYDAIFRKKASKKSPGKGKGKANGKAYGLTPPLGE